MASSVPKGEHHGRALTHAEPHRMPRARALVVLQLHYMQYGSYILDAITGHPATPN